MRRASAWPAESLRNLEVLDRLLAASERLRRCG